MNPIHPSQYSTGPKDMTFLLKSKVLASAMVRETLLPYIPEPKITLEIAVNGLSRLFVVFLMT